MNHNSRTVELWDSCNGLLDFTAVSVRGCGKIHDSVWLSLSCPAPTLSVWSSSEYGRGCVGGCCSLLLRPCHSLLVRAEVTHVWTKHKKEDIIGSYTSFGAFMSAWLTHPFPDLSRQHSGRNIEEKLSRFGTFPALNVSPHTTSKRRELVIRWYEILSQKKGCFK